MPIEITTVYDRALILRFNRLYAKTKAPLWWIMGLGTAYIWGAWLYLYLVWGITGTKIDTCLLFISVMDAVYLFCMLILPYFTVNRSKALGSTNRIVFSEESVLTQTVAQQMTGTSTVRYEALHRVIKEKDMLYLFLNRNSAVIVDLREVSPEQFQTLRTLLQGAVKKRKFKWK